MTDHADQIAKMRAKAKIDHSGTRKNNLELAADLLEMHDATGISLDNWKSARQFVEHHMGYGITENGA